MLRVILLHHPVLFEAQGAVFNQTVLSVQLLQAGGEWGNSNTEDIANYCPQLSRKEKAVAHMLDVSFIKMIRFHGTYEHFCGRTLAAAHAVATLASLRGMAFAVLRVFHHSYLPSILEQSTRDGNFLSDAL